MEVIRREWGFDEPLPVQYVNTMEKLFGGNLVSYFNQLDVREEIWKGMPRTLSLALGAALLWILGRRRARGVHRPQGRRDHRPSA